MSKSGWNGIGHYLRAALIIAAASSLYVAGSGRVALWDRDEAWYAQTSRQMLESGNWLIPHFLDQPRFAKPIFIYWCQAVTMKFLGHISWEMSARLPSAIAMMGTCILLMVALGRGVGPRRMMYTLLIFATSAIVIISAKMCLTDSVMLLFLTGAQLCLFTIYRRTAPRRARRLVPAQVEAVAVGASGAGDTVLADPPLEPETPSQPPRVPRWLTILMWVCVGMAGLTKGPIVLIVILSTLLMLALFDLGAGQWKSLSGWKRAIGWWPQIRPLTGLGIALAIVIPWLVAVYLKEPEFLKKMLQEPVKHASGNQDGHSAYPGYYLLTIWITFFPWSLIMVTGLVLGWKHRKTPHVRFALATIIGNWIYAEIMITKLPHYMMPSFIALAFLTATALIRCMRRQHDDMLRPGAVIAAAGWALAAIALSLVPWMPLAIWDFPVPRLAGLAFASVGIVYALTVLVLFALKRLAAAATVMGVGMMAVIAIAFTLYLPDAAYLRVPSRVGARLQALGAVHKGDAIMTGFAEPSLAFYQGGTIREPAGKHYLQTSSPEEWPRWIVTTAKEYDALAPEKRARLRKIDSYRGLNYNVGDNVVEVLILEHLQPSRPN